MTSRAAAAIAALTLSACGTADPEPTPTPTTAGGQTRPTADKHRPTVAAPRAGETLAAVVRRRTALQAAPSPDAYGVTDRLDSGGAGSPYGCCVLALTGHQPDVPQDWPGGDRLAIHGTNDPASVGTAASHGCLRASEKTMRLLIAKVPLGAQVEIRS